MGESLCLRRVPQVQVKSVHWLLPFSARCTKTKQNEKLEPCPLDKEHPVSWRHSTSGGLMLLLSNAWPGDTVILCLASVQGESWHLKGTKKLLHVMPRHPLLFHWRVGACELHRHELMWLRWCTASASVPEACAKTHGTSQHLLFSVSVLPRFLSNSGLKYQSRWRDNQRSFTVTGWD